MLVKSYTSILTLSDLPGLLAVALEPIPARLPYSKEELLRRADQLAQVRQGAVNFLREQKQYPTLRQVEAAVLADVPDAYTYGKHLALFWAFNASRRRPYPEWAATYLDAMPRILAHYAKEL